MKVCASGFVILIEPKFRIVLKTFERKKRCVSELVLNVFRLKISANRKFRKTSLKVKGKFNETKVRVFL